jgi:hypothetical protein
MAGCMCVTASILVIEYTTTLPYMASSVQLSTREAEVIRHAALFSVGRDRAGDRPREELG